MIRGALAAIAATACLAAHGAREIPAAVREAFVAAGVSPSSVAIVVEPADAGAPLLAHRERETMTPASTMKLVTSAAALDLLGPAFRFHTDVLLSGPLHHGVLTGDLVLHGGGDPLLTYERVWQMAHSLRSRGLREIRGDVVLDRSYFAPASYDAGAFDNEPRRAYNVPPDALLVNFGAVDFRFVPADGAVQVVPEPDLPYVKLATRVRGVPGACGAWRRGLRYEVRSDGLLATVAFTGDYPLECGEHAWPLAVLDGTRMLEAVWRWAWSEAGGRFTGKVREGAVPSGARLFLRHDSEPLAALLRDMNKFSNNVMARNLFLTLSAERSGGPGRSADSTRIVREWLTSRSIEAPELVIDNGSGLSRDERASAATLAAVLRSTWQTGLMPELAASLPIFAVDGTFEERPAIPGTVVAHMKGGTLTGVQAMAGYVGDRAGRRWIAVMIVNDAHANASQPAFDALLGWIGALEAPATAPVQ